MYSYSKLCRVDNMEKNIMRKMAIYCSNGLRKTIWKITMYIKQWVLERGVKVSGRGGLEYFGERGLEYLGKGNWGTWERELEYLGERGWNTWEGGIGVHGKGGWSIKNQTNSYHR